MAQHGLRPRFAQKRTPTVFAGLGTLKPRVVDLVVGGASAVVEPRATGRATAPFAGSFHRAALRTYATDCLGHDGRSRGRWRCHAGIDQTWKETCTIAVTTLTSSRTRIIYVFT